MSVILLVAASAVLLVMLISDGHVDDPLAIVLLGGAAVAGLAAWANEQAIRRRRSALDEKRRGEMAGRARKLERSGGETETKLKDVGRELEAERGRSRTERELRLRSERARRAEREWTRELREQVLSMYHGRGPGGDLRELVLEVAVGLSGAEKGVLLSQHDGDGDGRLDLVCHRGFRRDPGASSLAQRFADSVLARDEIVREDDPGDGQAPADEEIDNLVAIPMFMHDDFEGVIVCANRPGGFEELDDDVLLALGDHAGAALENHALHGQLRSSYLAVVRMLADAIEAKDPFTRARSDEVSAGLEAVARHLALDDRTREQIIFAGILRDVGKLGISDNVLLKDGPLDAEERALLELHPLIGARIVERVPGLVDIAPMIRHHHERWDGGGYPEGLLGEEIPLGARMVAVADTYSAMTSTRPYRRPVSREAALEEIERCAGSQFDPEVARLFIREMRSHGPEESDNGTLAESLRIPAVQARRRSGEPLLGHGHSSATDPVTLLCSHRSLHEAIDAEASRAQREQRPFAVLMIELPELSHVNRIDGYEAGDGALRRVADAVERELAGTPATAGRVSGRRLAVLFPDCGHKLASAVGAQIAGNLADGDPTPIRSAVAVWQSGDGGEDVLARARLALDTDSSARD